LVTEDLERDLKKLCSTLKDYKECKRYVEEQVAMSKPAHFTDDRLKKGKIASKEEMANSLFAKIQELRDVEGDENYECEPCDPSKWDEMEGALMAIKGGGGGNKGGGKGQFDGNCNF
jgi:hypothetical protein